jgi:hypothetical protein
MVHFSLWSNGGPNWKREFVIWMDLQEREWTTVHRKHSYASVVQNSVARNRPQNPTVFQRLQFPVDYQDNFRDEINRYTDHSKELLADLRPKTVFQRLAYPMALHQPRTSSGSVHPQARVHRNDSALNFKQGRNQGAHFKAADSINTSNLGRGFAAQGNQFNKERLNAQQFRPFKGKCYKCLGWGHTRPCATTRLDVVNPVTTMGTYPGFVSLYNRKNIIIKNLLLFPKQPFRLVRGRLVLKTRAVPLHTRLLFPLILRPRRRNTLLPQREC